MSQQVNLSSRGGAWRRILASNTTASAFVTDGLQGKPYGQIAYPWADATGMKVILVDPGIGGRTGPPGAGLPNSLVMSFFGVGASDTTGNCRVWGLAEGLGLVGSTETHSVEAHMLCELALMISNNKVGVANTLIGAADVWVDTITLTTGATQDNVIANSSSDVRGAWCRVDMLGFSALAIELNVGTATSINGLYRYIW